MSHRVWTSQRLLDQVEESEALPFADEVLRDRVVTGLNACASALEVLDNLDLEQYEMVDVGLPDLSVWNAAAPEVRNVLLRVHETIEELADEYEGRLRKARLIDGEDLAQIMAAQFSYRYVKVDGQIPEELVDMVPLDLMARYKFVPFKKQGDQLTIAMAEPKHLLKLVDELEMLTDLEVTAVVASEQNIKRAIHRIQKSRKIIDATSDGMQLSVVKESDKGEYILSAEKVSTEESPIVKLVDTTILDAINKRSSDIHIETTAKGIIIRYRINGMLHQATNPIDAKHQSPIISRIKVMSGLNIAERRLPQDGRFDVKVGDQDTDLRVSTIPTSFGERVVMRLLK